MTPRGIPKGAWVPAYAGMTRGPPHPASLDGWPPSPARGEADWVPAYARMTLWPPHPARPSALPPARPASPAVGRGVLDCCLRRNDTVAPSPGGALGTAGLSRGGERRTGFLLAQE